MIMIHKQSYLTNDNTYTTINNTHTYMTVIIIVIVAIVVVMILQEVNKLKHTILMINTYATNDT